jgi:hypothetical protein
LESAVTKAPLTPYLRSFVPFTAMNPPRALALPI